MVRSDLGIIIPAYNEELTISKVILASLSIGTPIIIDDGSTDQTLARSEALGALVVKHSRNLGYDAALNSGFSFANRIGCEYVITVDADGQHDPKYILEVALSLRSGADLVIGVRDKSQRFAEFIFSNVAFLLWGLRDPLSGLKGYRMELYRKLGHFDSYGSVGTELSLYAARSRMKIFYVSINLKNRLDAPRFGGRLKGNLRIFVALFKGFLINNKT